MKPARHFKVVGGKDVGGTPPNQSVIEVLEEALEIARRGVLQSVVLVGLTDKRIMVNGWSETDSVFTLLGALTRTVTDYQDCETDKHPSKRI